MSIYDECITTWATCLMHADTKTGTNTETLTLAHRVPMSTYLCSNYRKALKVVILKVP